VKAGSDIFYLRRARHAVSATDLRILPAYLSQLGFSPFQIGIVATAALAIGLLAVNRRAILTP
jgi:hypothetical protein